MVTVTSSTFLKEWSANGRSGKVFTIALSDGTTGQAFSEIPAGTPKEDLEITPNGDFPPKIKWNKGNKGGFGKAAQRAGNESCALSYAKDLACAHIRQGKDFGAKDILAVAEVFYQWLETKKK